MKCKLFSGPGLVTAAIAVGDAPFDTAKLEDSR